MPLNCVDTSSITGRHSSINYVKIILGEERVQMLWTYFLRPGQVIAMLPKEGT